jgi:predicted  nucleic acid-binding Zn-ribbon protein
LRSRGRKSIAEARNGVCSACHTSLPVGTVAALKHQVELLKCTNCGRYIFLAADDAKSALRETH